MKVPFCKSVDVESEVNIGVDDITSALNEALSNAEEAEKGNVVLRFINDAYQCLSAVNDVMIIAMAPKQRELISAALRAQADRYWLEAKS